MKLLPVLGPSQRQPSPRGPAWGRKEINNDTLAQNQEVPFKISLFRQVEDIPNFYVLTGAYRFLLFFWKSNRRNFIKMIDERILPRQYNTQLTWYFGVIKMCNARIFFMNNVGSYRGRQSDTHTLTPQPQ